MSTILITPRFPPESCGVGDYAFRLAETLQAGGQGVRVVTRPAGVERPAGVRVTELPLRGWRDLNATLQAIIAMHPARVQLEYSPYGWGRWGCPFWLNALALGLRVRGVEFAVALHEIPFSPRQRPKLAPLSLVQWLHVWLLAATAHDVMLNMAERIAVLRRWQPWRKQTVIYRPNASTIAMQPISAEECAAIRRQRGVPTGASVVCTFGLYQSSKNYQAAVEAVGLASRGTDLRLWMLGDARGPGIPLQQKLQSLAAACNLREAAWWPGYMDARTLSAHLQAADIFVLPQADGHLTRSSAFMAAAAHGLAVIAVRNPVNQQEFTHGENVWLVERSEARQFAQAIATLAADRELRSKLSGNLHALYRARFDWKNSYIGGELQPVTGGATVRAPGP